MEPTALPAEAATVAGAVAAEAAELLIVIPTGAVEVAAVDVGAEAAGEKLGDRRAVRLRFIFGDYFFRVYSIVITLFS